MSDLTKAHELEQLRYMETLSKFSIEEQERVRKQDADFAARGMFKSGAREMAKRKARIDKIESGINARLEIRRDLARSFPELGSDCEIDKLSEEILRTVEHAAVSSLEGPPTGAVRGTISARVMEDVRRLQAGAKNKIEILRRECALKLHEQQPPRSVSIVTGGGSALVNLGTIYGDVQQVINNVQEAGQAELADLLRRFAEAISETEALGEERATYLEQLRFIAGQVTLPADERQPGVIKGLLVGLRAGLHDVAQLAGILSLTGPAIAKYFGVPWPF